MKLILLALLSVTPGTDAHHYVNLTSTYLPYEIDGLTVDQIVGSLARNGPRDRSGTVRSAGLTEAEVTWIFRTWQSADKCEISDVQVNVDITVRLPKHRNQDGLPHVVSRQFDKYAQALGKHEHTHHVFAQNAAYEIAQLLSSQGSDQAKCTQVERRLNKSAREIVRRHHHLNKQYDLRTQYGGKEGVFLRPADSSN